MKYRLALLLLLAGCSNRHEPTGAYPPARWRLASKQQLAQTMVYASHILIRYSGLPNDEVCFSLADFHSTAPAPARTREQARNLAERVADQALAAPERFASLAREYSEDIVRRDQGGSLGYTTALQLSPWPEVLDALATLQPGQVSRVVETTCGFHVIHRAEPPAPDIVSGIRLVIGHQQAAWLAAVAKASPRSRDAALELAGQLYARASEHPEHFADLIREHSEGPEMINGGDLGSWSTREPTAYPREVEVLSQIPVGGLAPPIDGVFGIEILMRTPNRTRQHLALEGFRMYFNREAANGAPESEEHVLELLRAKNAELHNHPEASAEDPSAGFIRQHWLEGRDDPALTAALERVSIGELLPEPVRSVNRYVVGRRVAPPPLEEAETWFELPSPAEPDVRAVFTRLRPADAQRELQRVTADLQGEGALDETAAAALQELVTRYPSAHDEPLRSYESFDGDVRRLLGDRYEQYRRILNGHLEALLLQPRKPRS